MCDRFNCHSDHNGLNCDCACPCSEHVFASGCLKHKNCDGYSQKLQNRTTEDIRKKVLKTL